MTQHFWRTAFKTISFAVFCAFLLTTCRSAAQDYFAGARGGVSFLGENDHFYQLEAVAGRDLPWHWNCYLAWFFQPTADISVGMLSDGHTEAFIGELGGNLELHYGKFPVYLEAGFNPTVLSTCHFGAKNFGSDIQFTSDIALDWKVTERFTLGCRVQHMSNGRIAEPNPGLDVAELTATFHF